MVRASLIAVAPMNFFNLMFAALFLLYAVRDLHIAADVVGLVVGVAASAACSARWSPSGSRRGSGSAGLTRRLPASAAPLVLWPLAQGPMTLVIVTVFVAEFVSGFGVLMLDVSIGAIFAAVIPGTLRSCGPRVQAVDSAPGRSARCSAGCSGRVIGLRPTLLIAALGGLLGFSCCCPRRCLGTGCPRRARAGVRSAAGLAGRLRRRTDGRPGSSSTRSPG